MEVCPDDSFCSLDMLAEVATATLKSDLSLSSNVNPRKFKYNISNICIGSSSRKNVTNSEKLTLDQIKVLSDKMLIEMFSELICDEIRKNYSFKCFLIPDKCSQIFKSFGNEARARCKMKSHLQSHINDLVSEESGNTCESFTAEPLHVRRKRLQELDTKIMRKKKKSKVQNIRKRKDSYQNDINTCNNTKPKQMCAVKDMYNNSQINLHHDFGKCVSTQFNQEMEDVSDKFSENYGESFHSTGQIALSDYSVDGPCIPEMLSETNVMNKFYARRNKRKKNLCSSSTSSDYVVKWNVDFDETYLDNSSLKEFKMTNLDSYKLCYHDHTYTSVHGKTYDLLPDEYNKTTTDAIKYHCKKIANDFIPITTPPFPYVHVPLLPYVAEVKEIESSSNSMCEDNFLKQTKACEDSCTLEKTVENTSSFAHLDNPSAIVCKQELNNFDDPDFVTFNQTANLRQSNDSILRQTKTAKDATVSHARKKTVGKNLSIIRLGNRVPMVTKQKSVNTEDYFIEQVSQPTNLMQSDCILAHNYACEDTIVNSPPEKIIENTSSVTHFFNRVPMVSKQESDNSEDPYFVERVNQTDGFLQTSNCSNDFVNTFHENYINETSLLNKNPIKKDLLNFEINDRVGSAGNDTLTEENENIPSASFLDVTVSKSNMNAKVNKSRRWTSFLNLDDILKTDCHENLQSIKKIQ